MKIATHIKDKSGENKVEDETESGPKPKQPLLGPVIVERVHIVKSELAFEVDAGWLLGRYTSSAVGDPESQTDTTEITTNTQGSTGSGGSGSES